MMERIEIFNKLAEWEAKKIEFENIENEFHNYYFKGAEMTLRIETANFNKQYHGEVVEVTKGLFLKYVKEEIENCEIEIDRLIKRLSDRKG